MARRVAVIDCGSSKVGDIVTILEQLGAAPRRSVLETVTAATFEHVEAVVISGGPRLFTAEPDLIDRFAFLERLDRPVLGICLGHQALAILAGARVFLGPARRDREDVRRVEPHPLFEGLDPVTCFGTDHCEGVSLPPGYRRIAESASYGVEAMAHHDEPRWGVQFHPEMSGQAGRRLFANMLASI